MPIRKRGGSFQVDVTHAGRRYRQAAPTARVALALEARMMADLIAGRGLPWLSSTKPCDDLRYLGPLFEHTLRVHWRGTKNERLASANGHLWVKALGEDFDVSRLGTQHIADQCDVWVQHGNSAATINRKLAALRKMLAVANEEGVLDRIPTMPKRKEYAGRIRFFSDEEERSMLEFFRPEPDMRDLIVLGLDTGLRQGELLALEWRDYVLETNLLHVWESKSDSPRAVPLTARARATVVSRCDNIGVGLRLFPEELTSRRISERMYAWRQSAGLEGDKEAVFHALRHTCCSRLIQSGVGLVTVQKWMGHKTIETTLRYAHLAPNAFDEAVAALDHRNQGRTLT